MKSSVRLEWATPDDAEAMLAVHRAAVRGTAVGFYDPAVIEDWGSPTQPENVAGLAQRIRCGEEEAVIARDAFGRAVGFGSIVPRDRELRGLYVHPAHGRSGIGAMLVAELEVRARRHGLTELTLDASINAEAFYRRNGYQVEGRGEHVLPSGRRIACAHMRKQLQASATLRTRLSEN